MKFPDFSRGRVLVIGDCMLDRYWHGPCQRISPEAPVPIVRVERDDTRPGGAANVAANVAQLGACVKLLGIVGNDSSAIDLRALLDERRVAHDLHTCAEVSTVTKLRIVSLNQQLLRADFEDDLSGIDTTPLRQRFDAALNDCDVVVLSDYAKGTLAAPRSLIEAARAASKAVVVDPKGRDFDRYHGASILTPNRSEFEAVVGPCHSDADLEQRARAMVERLALDAVLITLSDRGVLLVPRDAEAIRLAANAREVYDVTGAGDSVIATLASAIAAGSPWADAVTLANIAGGLAVAKLGTASLGADELHHALNATSNDKHHTHEALHRIVRERQSHGQRVVMTNGCFDLLHSGHVEFLTRARALGDWLIVAVNDDASVRRLKGHTRPIVTLEHRLRTLAGLQAVDALVSFSDDTPEALICQLLPDILVKGADYAPEHIAGGHCVRAAGGRTEVIALVEGQSTSAIIEHIRHRC